MFPECSRSPGQASRPIPPCAAAVRGPQLHCRLQVCSAWPRHTVRLSGSIHPRVRSSERWRWVCAAVLRGRCAACRRVHTSSMWQAVRDGHMGGSSGHGERGLTRSSYSMLRYGEGVLCVTFVAPPLRLWQHTGLIAATSPSRSGERSRRVRVPQRRRYNETRACWACVPGAGHISVTTRVSLTSRGARFPCRHHSHRFIV